MVVGECPDALALIDMRVLAYLLIGGATEYSFAEACRL